LNRSFVPAAALAVVLGCVAPAVAAVHAGDVPPALNVASDTGGKLTGAAFKGKPLYLNFFASWCGPCNDEAPAIRGFYQKYHKRGLAIVGVDELESASTAKDFVKKYGWPFAVGVDSDGNTLAPYQSIGLPVHVFIDKHGKVSTYRDGQMDPNEIEDAIKKIL
jgi:thiol-disulfide isomerase/thioredoxin